MTAKSPRLEVPLGAGCSDAGRRRRRSLLLDDTLQRELTPVAKQRGVGLINAAAVALGLLTPGGSNFGNDHLSTPTVRVAAAGMVATVRRRATQTGWRRRSYPMALTARPPVTF